jgi:hypothetical protein
MLVREAYPDFAFRTFIEIVIWYFEKIRRTAKKTLSRLHPTPADKDALLQDQWQARDLQTHITCTALPKTNECASTVDRQKIHVANLEQSLSEKEQHLSVICCSCRTTEIELQRESLPGDRIQLEEQRGKLLKSQLDFDAAKLHHDTCKAKLQELVEHISVTHAVTLAAEQEAIIVDNAERYAVCITNCTGYCGSNACRTCSNWRRHLREVNPCNCEGTCSSDCPELYTRYIDFVSVIEDGNDYGYIDGEEAAEYHCEDFAEPIHASEERHHARFEQLNDELVAFCWNLGEDRDENGNMSGYFGKRIEACRDSPQWNFESRRYEFVAQPSTDMARNWCDIF